MVLGIKRFGTVILVAGVVSLLVGLLAVPAGAQQTSNVDQYADEAVCQAVINIILDNSQSNSQTDQYIGRDNINDIAQELNISPSIVQNCAEEGGVDLDDNGTTGDDGTTDGATEGEAAVLTSTAVEKALPVTGGSEIFWMGGALLMGAGLTMWRMIGRRS